MRPSRFDKLQLNRISIEYAAITNHWEKVKYDNQYTDNRQRCNIIIKHAFASACRNNTNLSLSEIGGVIDKDHSLVVHACKNHDSNYKYLRSYSNFYDNINKEMLEYLNTQMDTENAESIKNIRELRERLILVTSKLRGKINEIKTLKQSKDYIPVRLKEENDFLKKHSKEIYERNKKLNKELIRLKNLL